MNKNKEAKKEEIAGHKDIQQSLCLSLYPKDWLEKYGSYGLELMKKLVGTGHHLPLFASIDSVCSFFSAFDGTHPHLTQACINNSYFKGGYEKYSKFIRMIRDLHAFREIGYFEGKDRTWKASVNLSNGNKDRNRFLYQAFEFILIELVMRCPFMNVESVYDHEMLRDISWESFVLPEKKDLNLKDEKELLIKLKLSEYECRLVSLESNDDGRFGVLVETCFQKYKAILSEHLNKKTTTEAEKELVGSETLQEQTECLTDLSRIDYLIDYKLIHLYLKYCSRYELSEQLRHKIAILKYYTRNATDRNPFYTKCEKQDKSGMPNPAFLVLGKERFFLKMLGGEPVFIGDDSPIQELENMIIRFYFIEEMNSVGEKVDEGDRRGCHPHLTIHKLISLLLCHDIVAYLGGITHMDVRMEFHIYREPATRRDKGLVQSTHATMKYLREKSKVNSGFLAAEPYLQRGLFLEMPILEAGYARFDDEFYGKYLYALDDSFRPSKYRNIFNIFFGRGGAFLNENVSSARSKGKSVEGKSGHYTLSRGLKETLQNSPVKALFTTPSDFIAETNHRYLFVEKSADVSAFVPFIESSDLAAFLDQTREFFLNLTVEESIKRIMGASKEVKT